MVLQEMPPYYLVALVKDESKQRMLCASTKMEGTEHRFFRPSGFGFWDPFHWSWFLF
jgi:hypothetical protein